MLIRGCVAYKNKKEKLVAWKQIKQEFGDSVKILFEDGLITYTCIVDRNFI